MIVTSHRGVFVPVASAAFSYKKILGFSGFGFSGFGIFCAVKPTGRARSAALTSPSKSKPGPFRASSRRSPPSSPVAGRGPRRGDGCADHSSRASGATIRHRAMFSRRACSRASEPGPGAGAATSQAQDRNPISRSIFDLRSSIRGRGRRDAGTLRAMGLKLATWPIWAVKVIAITWTS